MMNFLRKIFSRDYQIYGVARSPKWSAFRKNYLKGKSCAVCGGTDTLELHHIKMFSQYPELELSEDNVLPLCESGKNGVVCHRFFGHLGNYRKINPSVIQDVNIWNQKLK